MRGLRAAWLSLVVLVAPAFASADGPVDRALELTARGEAWPRGLAMTDARLAAGVDVAWPRTPALGAGAAVCVVDTGVDLAHPTFRDVAGLTRALWVLDLASPPVGRHVALEREFGGAVLDASDVDAALSAGVRPLSLRDPHGHGSAVAGAAVGDDAGLGPALGAHAGVAPRASLVVVRALRPGLAGLRDEDVIAGARFCTRVLSRERSVLLFALGGHDGAHDGTEVLETSLASLVHDGWVLVAAAGNEGAQSVHAGGTVSFDRPIALELRVPAPVRAAHVVLSVRSSEPIEVETPRGTVGPVSRGEQLEAPGVVIDARSGRATYVVLRDEDGAPLGGTYWLRTRGDVDAWITEHDLGPGLDAPRFVGRYAQPAETVAIPATEPALIAVGALVSRAAWASDVGLSGLAVEPEPVTARAPFSARGPSAHGWARPDLLAPGALVRTTLSTSIEVGEGMLFADEVERDRFVRGDGLVLAGTSVAAAVVAGAIALARAEHGGLSPDEERAALMISARDPEGRGDPTTLALDVAAYLQARTGRSSAPSSVRSTLALSRGAVRPGTVSLAATVLVRDEAGVPVRTTVEIRHGDRVLAAGSTVGGVFRAALAPLSGDVGTTLLLEAYAGATSVGQARVLLAPDERGGVVEVSPSCAASSLESSGGSGRRTEAWAALAVLIAFREISRRRAARRVSLHG